MTRYIATRLALAVPTVLGATLLVFVLTSLLPGDVVDSIFAEYAAGNEAAMARLREQLGFDEPLPVRYLDWLGNLATGDFGQSLFRKQSVAGDIGKRLPVTIEVALLAQILAVTIAIPVGMLAAVRRNSLIDQVSRSIAVIFLAIPGFWLGTMILVLGSVWLRWAPPITYSNLWDDPIANLQIVIWPAIVVACREAAILSRVVRTTMLEVIFQDYVRTARAKGLGSYAVVGRHALRNALLPIVTLVGLSTPGLVGGAVVIESVFNLPGMGTYLLGAIQVRDIPVIQGVVLVVVLAVVLANIAIDVAYGALDPRVRHG